jgi:hypothetical protein
MDDASKDYIEKDVTVSGKTVTIVAQFAGEEGWELVIIGKNNQCATWTEFFATSAEALDEGYAAILDEGIDGFYASPEFAYLDKL